MKPTHRAPARLRLARRFILDCGIARVCAAVLTAAAAHAATLTWDIAPGTVGAGDSAITGGAGTWNLANGNWTADAGANNVAWNNATPDSAIFQGAGDAVTLGAGITVDDITFSTAGYALTGNTLTLMGTPTITTVADATISSALAGTVGLTKLGTAQLTLNGSTSNTFTGTTILNNGTLVLGKTGGALAIIGNVQMGAGASGNQPNLRMAANEQFGAGVVMTFVNPVGSYPRFDLQGTTQTLAGIVDATAAGVLQNEKLGGGGTAAAGTLTVNGTGTYSYNGYLRDQDNGGHVFKVNLVKSGTGTQTLAGGNVTYQGTTTVNGGVLESLNNLAFASAVTVNSGGTLRITNNTASTAYAPLGGTSPVVVNSGGVLELNNATTGYANRKTFASGVSGAGTINVVGSGYLALPSVNNITLTGQINVQSGGLGNDGGASVNAFGTTTATLNISSGAFFDLRGGASQFGALNGGGILLNSWSATTVTLGAAGGSGTFTGTLKDGGNAVTGTGGGGGSVVSVTKIGTGSQTLGTANVAGSGIIYTGTTTVNAGTLVLKDGRLVGGVKTVAAGATLEINSTIPFATRWNNSGTISGAGIINKTGSGVFGTVGAVNFSGQINILEGRWMNDNTTGDWTNASPDVNVSAGAILDLRANAITVDELNGLGEVCNSHPANGTLQNLTVGVANGSSTFGGVIADVGSQPLEVPTGGSVRLTKAGTGTLTITGGANVYSGATTVNNGVLRISGGSDRLPTATNLTVNGGATSSGTFNLNGLNQTVGGISGASGAVAGVITSSTGAATLTANVAGANVFITTANITDSGGNVVSLTKLGTGTQGLAGTNTYSGSTFISAGALRAASASPFSPNSNLQLIGGVIEAGFADFALTTGAGGGQLQWFGDGGFSAAGAARNVTLNGGAPLTWGAGSFVPNGSKLLFGSAAGDNMATLTNNLDLAGATRTVEITNGPAAIEGALGGTVSNGTLNLRGNQGTLALTGQTTANVVVDNTLTGTTNLMNLVLNRSAGNALAGGLQIGATSNNQFATVRLGADEQIVDTTVVTFGAAAGSWSYLNLFGFNETIAGLSSLPGSDGGVVQLVEGDISPATNSTLTLNVAAGTRSYFGHIRDRVDGGSNDPGLMGRLGFVKTGAGTQELTTWNTQVWTGATTVNQGTLRLALAGATGGGGTLSSASTVNPAGTLDFTNAPNGNAWTFDGALSGAGTVVKSGPGYVTFTGAGLANTGPTTVTSGVLRLLDTTYASATTVSPGAYLEEFRSAGTGALALSVSGAGGFIKNGDGETTLGSPLSVAQVIVRRGNLTPASDNVLTAANTVAVSGHLTPTLKLNGTTQTIAGLAASRDASARVVGGSTTVSALTVGVPGGRQTVFGGSLGGGGGDENNLTLTKAGNGTLVLNGIATHTGGTVISAGTLQLGASTTVPVNLATLGIWLDGTDPAATGLAPTDGAAISVWKNKGTLGATGDFSAPAGREPSYGASGSGLINGHSTVRFVTDATNPFAAATNYNRLTNSINLSGGPSTILIAGRYSNDVTGQHGRLVSALGNNYLLGWWNNGENGAYYGDFAPFIGAGTTNAHLLSSVLRGDGVAETYNENAKLGALANAYGPVGLSLGGGYLNGSTENSTGDLGEVIIVPGILGDADRAAIEAYLARKWTGFLPTDPLPTTGTVNLSASGATLAVNGVTQTLGSLSGVAGTGIALGGGALTVGNDGGSAAFAGVISGGGTLAKTGGGTWTLSGANTYTAPTSVRNGTLALSGGANRLPVGTAVDLGTAATSGTLKLGGNSQTVAGLTSAGFSSGGAGSRVVNDSATPATLTVNLTAGTNTFSGKLGGTTANENNLALRKEGAGTLALTNASTYTGATVIAGGTIRLGGDTTLRASAAIWLDATDGATINTDVNGVLSWTNKGTLGASGDFAPAVAGLQQPGFVPSEPALGGNSVIHFSSANNDRLQTALNFASNVTVAYIGRLSGGSNARLVSATNNNWLLGTWGGNRESAYFENGFLYNAGTPDTTPRFFIGTIAGDGAAAFYSNGNLLGNGTGTGPNGLRLGGGYLNSETEFSDGDIGEVFVFHGVLSATDRARLDSYIAWKWFGAGASDVLPTGTAVALTASGATLDVNGITQTVGSISSVAGSTIALGGGTLTVGGDGSTKTVAGAITGGGTLTKDGAGLLTLTGTQTYDTLNANGGITKVNSALGTGTSVLNANATVNLNASQALAALNIAAGVEVTFGDGLPFAGVPEKGAGLGGVAVVPEPGAVALLLAGALGLCARRRIRVA